MKTKNNKETARPYSEGLKEYLQKIAKKQIPLESKDFQKKIIELRRKWKIPLKGFKNKRATCNWFKFPPKKILKYPKTVEQVQKEIFHFGTSGQIITESNIKIIEDFKLKKNINNFPIGSFLTDIHIFMTKNHIDYTLTRPFLNLLYYGNIKKAPYPKAIIETSERITYTKSRKKVDHFISVSIGPNTRQKDILNVWDKLIVPLQEKLPGYQDRKTRNSGSPKNLSS